MIEINLLPGSSKKGRSRAGVSLNLGAVFSGVANKVKDPWLLGAVGSVALVGFGVGSLHLAQIASRADLEEKQQIAVQDSTRYAAVLREKRRVEAQRDSVLRQINIIRTIDDDRYVWPHIMDELSRHLPAYTWLTGLRQTSTPSNLAAAQGRQQTPQQQRAGARRGAQPQQPARRPVEFVRDTIRFQIVGNTVDIQALTRYMRLLEASPFVTNVQLARSTLVLVEGKEVTEFVLDAEFNRPDSTVIRLVPVTLSVR